MPSNYSRCGTDIEFEDFRSEGTEVVFSVPLPEIPGDGLEVPKVENFSNLLDVLRTKTVSEIVRILSNRQAERLYGAPNATLRNVASAFEEEHPHLAREIYQKNWERFRDGHSLSRLASLSAELGNVSDAFRYSQIATYFGETIDPFALIAATDFQHGGSFVESVLSEAIVRNPFRTAYLSDIETAKYLSWSRAFDESRMAAFSSDSPEAWEIRLQGLEYRALTLLDPVAFQTYVKTLGSFANATADFSGNHTEFLSEYACSSPSSVAESHYAFISGWGSIVTEDRSSVAELLYRRLACAAEHFFDFRFLDVHRSMYYLFANLQAPTFARSCLEIVESLKKQKAFYSGLPSSAINLRNRLLAEISSSRSSSYYPRIKAWVFWRKKPFSINDPALASLLLVDAIAQEDEVSQEIVNWSESLWKLEIRPDIASFVAFAFWQKSSHALAAEWISQSNLDDIENSSLLLRIVAEFRELSDTAIEAYRRGSPILKPSTEHAFARIRSVVQKYEPSLANEMLWDAEAGFWNPEKAIEFYRAASTGWSLLVLKKLADMEYALWRFKEAIPRYGTLYLSEEFAPFAAPKLCMDAIENDRADLALEYFSKVDLESDENFAVIANYFLYRNDPFSGLCALSILSGDGFYGLLPEVRAAYREYANFLTEGVGTAGRMDEIPSEEWLPSQILGLRTSALTFLDGPESGERYFRYISNLVELSEDTSRQAEVDVLIIGTLAPVHDREALKWAISDEEASDNREQALVDLLSLEARLLAETYRECATNPKYREAYVSLLMGLSVFFSKWDAELSAFFREAWVLATGGIGFDPEGESNGSLAILH